MTAMYTLIALGIAAACAVAMVIGSFLAAKAFYKVPKADEALVKTGGSSPVISTGGGLWVVPAFHQVARVSLQAMRIPISRTAENAVPSKDMIPAEIKGEMFVQVNPQNEADILQAVQALGTLNPDDMADAVREKIDSQVTDALRTAAFQKTFIELNSEKKQFADQVIDLLQEDLAKLGLTLTAVSVTHVSQGPFTGPDGDVIDAVGRRNVAETVEKNRQETNLITRNAQIEVQAQDVDAREKALELELRQKQKVADNQRQVEEYTALQRVETRKNVLMQEQAEAEAEADQARAVEEKRISERRKIEEAAIAKAKQVAVTQAAADAEQAEAQAKSDAARANAAAEQRVAEEQAEQRKQEAEIAKQKAVETATIAKQREIEQATIAKEQAVKVANEQRLQAIAEAEVEREQAVALRKADEAEARAAQATAEAKQRQAEESVTTVQQTAAADRQRQVVEIQAQEGAAKDKIAADRDAYVETKRAEGKRDAALKTAEAVKAQAEGQAHAKEAEAQGSANAKTIAAEAYAADIKVRADADAEAADKQASAKIKLAKATLEEGKAEAEARRLRVEAENAIGKELLLRDVAVEIVRAAPQVMHELMAPVAAVTHDVKVLQINGLTGGGAEGGESTTGTILGTGMALTGILPLAREAMRALVENEDVKEIAQVASDVATGAVKEAVSAVAEGVKGNGAGHPIPTPPPRKRGKKPEAGA